MKETPAEKMHNRILSGVAFSTREVTASDFESIAQRAGTSQLPEIKNALNSLRREEKYART